MRQITIFQILKERNRLNFFFFLCLFLSVFCLHLFESLSCIHSNIPLVKHLHMWIYFQKTCPKTVKLSVHILYKLQSAFIWICNYSRWRQFKKDIPGSWENKEGESQVAKQEQEFLLCISGKEPGSWAKVHLSQRATLLLVSGRRQLARWEEQLELGLGVLRPSDMFPVWEDHDGNKAVKPTAEMENLRNASLVIG